ncbi:hypothetical protein SK128_002476 [Halocaridina rubra]|uniref:Protein-tyrosine-phosphatase n=1 Tax=Halocaridina rubra TaxID=373956 RepID=A0AAN8ZXQ6_HALRR
MLENYSISWSNTDDPELNDSSLVPANESSFEITGLIPCSSYEVEVKAINTVGESDGVTSIGYTSVNVDATANSTTIDSLDVCTMYAIEIKPLNTEGYSKPQFIHSKTKAMVPGPPKAVTCSSTSCGHEVWVNWTKPESDSCTTKYIVSYTGDILWSGEIFNSTTTTSEYIKLEGLIPYTYYNICIAADSVQSTGRSECCTIQTQEKSPEPPVSFKQSNVISDAHSITLEWEQPTALNGNFSGYQLTWGMTRSNYLFIPANQTSIIIDNLLPGTTYTFTLQAKNSVGLSAGSSVTVTTAPAPEMKPLHIPGIILAVLGGALPILIIIGVVVYLSKKKKSQNDQESYVGPTPEKTWMGAIPIAKSDLPQYIAYLEAYGKKGLEKQFAALKAMSPKNSVTVAQAQCNLSKNRSRNALPYDNTRVILSSSSNDTGSDYINASYIKSKCEKYWPDRVEGTVSCGGFIMRNHDEIKRAFYTIRYLEISEVSESQERGNKRLIRQFHFTAWNDFDVPVREEHVLDFIQNIRSFMTHREAPMIVHCSTGVGRTGTFIALWNLLASIRSDPENPNIFIKKTILDMRESRAHMVQSQVGGEIHSFINFQFQL